MYADTKSKTELLTTYLEDTYGLEYREAWKKAERLMTDIYAWIPFRENGWRLVEPGQLHVCGEHLEGEPCPNQ